MVSRTIARRARRGIIIRLVLKAGLVVTSVVLLLAAFLFPQSDLWQTVVSSSAAARDAALQYAGLDLGKSRGDGKGNAEARVAASTELDRLRQTNGFAPSELRCLALAVYYESGREAREAQIGVAQVALNRAAAAKMPKLLCRVVYNGLGTPGACLFDTTCRNVGATPRQDDVLSQSIAVAVEVAAGQARIEELNVATHFQETRNPQPWSRGLFRITSIGKLSFLSTEQPPNAADPAPDPNAPAPERAARSPAGSATRKSPGQATGGQPTRADTRELSRQVFGID